MYFSKYAKRGLVYQESQHLHSSSSHGYSVPPEFSNAIKSATPSKGAAAQRLCWSTTGRGLVPAAGELRHNRQLRVFPLPPATLGPQQGRKAERLASKRAPPCQSGTAVRNRRPPHGGSGSAAPAGGSADSRFCARTGAPAPRQPPPGRLPAAARAGWREGKRRPHRPPLLARPPGRRWVAKRRPRAPHNTRPRRRPRPRSPRQHPRAQQHPSPTRRRFLFSPGGGRAVGGAGARHGLPGFVVAACFASLPLFFPHGSAGATATTPWRSLPAAAARGSFPQ